MNEESNTIKEAVLSKISRGEIKKISKIAFVIKSILFILAIIVVAAFVLFLFSFIIFALQLSELWYLPLFGVKGMELLLGNFPWLLVFLATLLVVCLEFLASRYRYVYRKPLLYSLLLIILIVVVISFFVRQTLIHEEIYKSVKKNNSGFAKMLYDGYTKPNSADFHPGTVVEINSEGFLIENRDKSATIIKITPKTQKRKNFKIFKGGRLLILGKIKNGVIEAEAIDNAPPNGRP